MVSIFMALSALIDLVHAGLEGGYRVAFVVLDAAHKERRGPDAVVGKGGIGAHHLRHTHLARTQTETSSRHGCRDC